MRSITLYSFFLFLVFFTMGWLSIPYNPFELKPAELLVNKILAKAADKMSKKYNLLCIGSGASMPSCVVHKLNLYFQIFRPLNKDEARLLLMEVGHDFMDEINSHPELAEYAPVFPFEPKNIEVVIYIKDSKGNTSYDPYLGLAAINKGRMIYWTYEKDTNLHIKLEEHETYEEAIEILQSQ